MASFSAGTSFTDGVANDVTAAKLGALVNNATPTSGLIQDRTSETITATNDTLLIGDASDSNNLKRITVANFAQTLPTAKITTGTIDTATLGTTTGTAATFTTGTITTGVIPTLTAGTTTGTAATFTTGTITTGVIPALTAGTTTSTAASVTNGTVQSLTSSTATITGGTFSGSINSTAGTVQSLTSSTSTVSEILTAKNAAINVTTLATASGTQNLDFSGQGYLTHAITGNITYTASNYGNGRSVTVRITSDGTARNLTFPTNWVFVGAKPTSVAASKNAILSVTSFGTTEANSVAAYAVQT